MKRTPSATIADVRLPAWAPALLRCPCCMSNLTVDVPAALLRCTGCGRAYPPAASGAGGQAIPRLKRDDTVATLAQDIVVCRSDADATAPDRRAVVSRFERRERFLAPLLADIGRPYAVLAARERPERQPEVTVMAQLHRFMDLLPRRATVLDLACGTGAWTARLARARSDVRIVGLDGSGPSLVRAAERLVDLHPPISSPSGGEGLTTLVEAEMMEMPLATASLDGVWCSEAIEYVRPDRRTVFFRQLHRVLRPGGVLYISAETEPLIKVVRQYLLWRVVFRRPVVFWEYIYRLPRAHGGGWHYHAMSSARALRMLCHDHGFQVLSLRRHGLLWLLLARKKA